MRTKIGLILLYLYSYKYLGNWTRTQNCVPHNSDYVAQDVTAEFPRQLVERMREAGRSYASIWRPWIPPRKSQQLCMGRIGRRTSLTAGRGVTAAAGSGVDKLAPPREDQMSKNPAAVAAAHSIGGCEERLLLWVRKR